MKKTVIFITVFFIQMQGLIAQDSIKVRLILMGDAGEKNEAQQAVLTHALQQNIPGKTIALFLGDNIYPKGVELYGAKKEASLAILRAQFEGLRKQQIPVYFIPGNHDWDKSGPLGYKKMLAANEFIESLDDSMLQIIPAAACPGPQELLVSGNVVVIAMDSEWWLFPFHHLTDKTDCECNTKRDVLGRLSDMVERNRDKLIIFATHHPFATHGSHGGYYSFKEHVFPLTGLNKNLYIPLPGVGSLYPLLRKTFPPAEDLGNILYRDMKQSVTDILKTHPNVVHVAGHEHSLQLIEGTVLQVVSGAGCKHTPVKMGKGSLYAADSSGYVLADIMAGNNMQLSFFTYDGKGLKQSFHYGKPYTQPAEASLAEETSQLGDSITMALQPSFNSVSGLHRRLFGENYRKLWATATTLPVFHLSATRLTPTQMGGGMQTRSLRMMDENKKEWVIRSIDKYPDALLPQPLAQTFASDLFRDNVSAIFPYAPLVVPVFARALGVAHATPEVMYVAPDKKLGIYSRDFANTVVLFEAREPMGKSTNTLKMLAALKADNENRIDQHEFLKARLLDIFLGDWDRHGDQWRWIDKEKGKSKLFVPVPRDRDQVFYVNQGLFPKILSRPWIMPKFEGFRGTIRNINTFSYNARSIDGLFTNQLSAADWQQAIAYNTNHLNDALIDTALNMLPASVHALYGSLLSNQLKQRRNEIQQKGMQYYQFLNKVVDITTSDKNEQVVIKDTGNGNLSVVIHKLGKTGEAGKQLYNRIFDAAITKEVHLYLLGGTDSVSILNNGSLIKVRIVGDSVSSKKYTIAGKRQYLRKLFVYEGATNAVFNGNTNGMHRYLSNKPANTSVAVSDRYNNAIPLVRAGYNIDDGVVLGAGIRWIQKGFRKQPYATSHKLVVRHAFASGAFSVKYDGDWLNALGNADIVLRADMYAPDNNQNFFGLGNNTVQNKTGNYKRFYRTRFNFIDVSPALRWRKKGNSSISIGPAFQYYHLDREENDGRFINNSSSLHSFDSATVFNDKAHAGLQFEYLRDNRNSALLPAFGSFVKINVQGFTGLNRYSTSFGQLNIALAGYKSIDRKSNIVIANRLGAGVTVGKPAFYQSLFLGGQDNLLGFRQFRFGGQHILYNNFEVRMKLANLASYVLPGQLGLVGFYDVGKVWQQGYNDKRWHQGVGGGLYFAPAQMFLLQAVMGHSTEGWLPYITFGCRF